MATKKISSFKRTNSNSLSGDPPLFVVMGSPVLRTALMINTSNHPQMFGEPG
jgi:hypothetical protein